MIKHEASPDMPLPGTIDHPVHPEWFYSGMALMSAPDAPEYDALRSRFNRPEDDFPRLIRNLGSISMYLDTRRKDYESTNWHVLNSAAEGQISQEALGVYETFAGKPELTGQYIAWFARVATAGYAGFYHRKDIHDTIHEAGEPHDREQCESYEDFLSQVGGVKSFNKISLDLGGRRQSGDWDSTKALDTWVAQLRAQIGAAEPKADITLTRKASEQLRGYKLYRWLTRDDEGIPDGESVSATVRRRRREAVVRIPGLREIVIIKESKGWLLPDEVEDDREREAILGALKNWHKLEEAEGKENSKMAQLAGMIFERAIRNRATTREVIPVHAHYYMQTSPDLPVVPPVA